MTDATPENPKPRASNPTLGKTIHGVPVTQNAFKRAIVEALRQMEGGGGVADLIPALGPEWDDRRGRDLLSKTMNNMASSGAIKRVEGQRGTFVPSGGFHRKGLGASDQIEQSILDSIRKRGGFATFTEIMDDHGLRPAGPEFTEIRRIQTRRRYGQDTIEDNAFVSAYDPRNSSGYGQIKKLLRESPLIRQDLIKVGLYNLPQDELNTLTIRGYYGGLMAKATVAELGAGEEAQWKARDDYFARVAKVFKSARELRKNGGEQGFGNRDFARRQKVSAALLSLMQIEAIAREVDDWYAAETKARAEQMSAEGASTKEIADYREDRRNSREGHRLLYDLLDRFENPEPGYGVNIHCWAPIKFYETLASELGIDPVLATRGVLMLNFRGEKLRPSRDTPDATRMAEIELFRESMMR